MSLRRVREQPGGGVEALREGARVTLWPGKAPGRPPEHPGLAWPIEEGWLHEQGVWLEHRPQGARLGELRDQLAPAEVELVLQHLAGALAALHEAGQHHGSVDVEHVVVSHRGRAVLIGLGQRKGSRVADKRALGLLRVELSSPSAAPPPVPGEATAASLGARSRAGTAELPANTETIPFRTAGAFDEVRLDLGPDRYGRGLLDRWATGHSLSGAHTGAIEWTRPGNEHEEQTESSAALLTRLVSPPERPPDPRRFAAVEGQPSEEIKALVANEPLEPLPLPSATRRRPLPAPLPEDNTDEPTRPTAIAEEVSETALRVVAVLLIAALVAVAIVLAWILGT